MSAPPLYTRAFVVACAIHLVGALSLAMWMLQPLYVRALGGTEVTIGLVLGLSMVASVATRPLVGSALDRFGRRHVLLAAGCANALSWLPFFLLARVSPWLYWWSAVHAVAWGALFAAYFTYAADLAPPARRAEGIAIFGMAGMIANGVGPWGGEIILERAGFGAFFATAALLALLSAGLTLLVPRRPRHAVAAPHGARRHWLADLVAVARHPGLGRVLVATMVLGFAIDAAFFFVAPFVHGLGMPRAGSFFIAYSATSVVIRFLGRRHLDVLGPHRTSIPAFGFFALGLLALGLLPARGVLVLSGMGCGAGHGTLFPVLNALATRRAPAGLQGTVVSLHTAALDLGGMVGTPLCGLLAQFASYPAMFAVTALACLGGLLLMLLDPVRRGAGMVADGGAP